MMLGFQRIQWMLDLFVAGISLMVVLGIFTFVASILCSAAFIHHSKLPS
ncbi:uncharacterized protein LOC120267680 [Dioscorea cayenensis subsp. rotundata]|uniref:Uncharacterized protein LOC120267680 n=1 Tax=Dioscorea cayennensis subsp. rotundata TaxID=55577 RepID=A0AB40BUZ5_DIOCR|nr:uncharacterized protein LOC120267680 [Dioscorea cayenensis subsp. rotundata]